MPFTVAFSFPGEHRLVVEQVADRLAVQLGRDEVLYDRYIDGDTARPNADLYLSALYRTGCELVVVLLCPEYADKHWCGLEWRSIRQLIGTEAEKIMLLSIGDPGDLAPFGLLPGDIYLDITGREPAEVTSLILRRLATNRTAVRGRLDFGAKTTSTQPVAAKRDIATLERGDVPVLPDIFLGRETDLTHLREILGNAGTTARAEPVIVRAVHGLAGIGKTALAATFATKFAREAGFVDGVLWASTTREQRFTAIARRWGQTLNRSALSRVASSEEAVSALREVLAEFRLLVVLDDLWSLEPVSFVRRALGRGSALLITTRIPRLSLDAEVSEANIHELPPLDRRSGLALLEKLCPGATIEHEDACDRLLNRVGYAPIAIHVAGRMLRRDSRAGMDVAAAIEEIDVELVLSSQAPLDRADPETGALPSVAALLKRSVAVLPALERKRFARLATFARDTTFDLTKMGKLWGVEDARESARVLHEHGLLEAVGGRYRLHSLLFALALRLLEEDAP